MQYDNLTFFLRTRIPKLVAFLLMLASVLGASQEVSAQGPKLTGADTSEQTAPFVRSYSVKGENEKLVQQFVKHFGSEKQFRQIFDRPTAQWVVVAPKRIHDLIAQQLPVIDQQAQASTETPAVAPRNLPQAKVKSQQLQLRTLTGQSLHARLEKVLNRRLPIQQDATGQWFGFNVDKESGRPVSIWANKQTGQTQISGTDGQIRSWRQVISALDTTPSAVASTEVVRTAPKSSAKVRQAVAEIRRSAIAAQTVQVETQGETSDQAGQTASEDTESDDSEGGAENSLLGPIQVETVEGTDILVIRGKPEDVERIMEVIREIESLAELGEPLVKVVQLQHIQSLQLSTTLERVFAESLTLDFGYEPLVVVPLLKPNAVMLVGLNDTVEKAEEIVAQLDQPGEDLTQFEVFRLEYAKATEARQVVQDLFNAEVGEGAPTLERMAVVIADIRTNTLIVRANSKDMDAVRALVDAIDQKASDLVNELKIFRLQHALAIEIETILRQAFTNNAVGGTDNLSQLLRLMTIDAEGRQKLESGVLDGVTVSAAPSANALIVSAPPDSMPLLAALINQLDQTPDAVAELKVFTIANGDAVALSQMIEGLFGNPTQQQRRGPGGPGQTGLTGLRVEVDERTNSIIAAGTSDDLLVVEAVLLKLDADDSRKRENKVYRLNNAFAEEVALSLQDWLEGVRNVEETAPGTSSPFQQIEREVVIVPDVSSNSLIVSASPKYYEEVDRIIKQLDQQAPKVMIQVLIAEIELGEADEFGIELGLQDSALFDRSLLTEVENITNSVTTQNAGSVNTITQQLVQTANLTPGFDFANGTQLGNSGSNTSLATAGRVAAQGLASFGVNRISPDAGFSGMIFSASSESVSMLLRALQGSRRMEVLSRPQIMAIDNQQGRAFVGETVPFITRTEVNQLGNPINSIERIEVGLNLEVTPRISPDGLVVMKIFAANDRLGNVADGVPIAIAPDGTPINSPIVDTIQAETTVSARTGQTIVLSGLLTKQDTALHRRVPILADIPLLGNLFRYDAVSTKRSELLIVLTPHIVRTDFEAEMIKQVESARMDWCLADVIDMHGPVGLRSRRDPAGATQAEVVYPELVAPEEYTPTVEPMNPSAADLPGETLPTLPPAPPLSSIQPTTSGEATAEKKSSSFLARLFNKSEETTATK